MQDNTIGQTLVGHIETQLKSLRNTSSASVDAFEREWVTIWSLFSHTDIAADSIRDVVDLGCGGRELSVGARDRGLSYRGFDIDDGNLEHDPIPCESETADLVVALALIEHLHNPDNFFSEALRILRPGGILFVSTPNWRYSWKTFYDNPAHVQPYSEKSLKISLEAYGFLGVNVVPGLRVRPKASYFGKAAFLRAALRPFRGPGRPHSLTGRATSVFGFGVKPGAEELS